MARVLILDLDAYARAAIASIAAATTGVAIPYDEAAHNLVDIPVAGWTEGDKIYWDRGDTKALIAGPYACRGWASRCIDAATSLWETYRLSRRAARRQRGRARAARRAAAIGRRLADRLEVALAEV